MPDTNSVCEVVSEDETEVFAPPEAEFRGREFFLSPGSRGSRGSIADETLGGIASRPGTNHSAAYSTLGKDGGDLVSPDGDGRDREGGLLMSRGAVSVCSAPGAAPTRLVLRCVRETRVHHSLVTCSLLVRVPAGTGDSGGDLVLATGSSDGTVVVQTVDEGRVLCVLRHNDDQADGSGAKLGKGGHRDGKPGAADDDAGAAGAVGGNHAALDGSADDVVVDGAHGSGSGATGSGSSGGGGSSAVGTGAAKESSKDGANGRVDPAGVSGVSAMCTLDGTPIVITGTENGVVWVWDVSTGQSVRLLRGHTGAVKCFSLHVDRTAGHKPRLGGGPGGASGSGSAS